MQALVTDLGFDVLFKGTNFTRLLGGMWVTLKISLISVALSIVLGILLGVVMTFKNPVTKAICRVYLEIVRIMPQLVLLFIVYYGSARLIGLKFLLAGAESQPDLFQHRHSPDHPPPAAAVHQPCDEDDQDHAADRHDRGGRSDEGRTSDH